MGKGKRGARHSVFLYFICYNLIILAVPILINIAGYYQADRVVEEKIVENSNILLQQAQRLIDERVKQVREMAVSISMDSSVLEYSLYSDSGSVDGIYGNYKIDKVLSKWVSINSFVDTIFIYYTKSRAILSVKDNSFPADEYFSRNADLLGGDPETWLAHMRSGITADFAPIHGDGEADGALAYLQNIPIENRTPGSDKLAVRLNRSFISDVFTVSNEPEQSLLCIVDSGGDIVYADGNRDLSALLAGDFAAPGANRVMGDAAGLKYMVSHTSSQITDWSYVSIVPLSIYMERSRELRGITYVLLGLGFVLGMVLCFHFARKNFQPVKQLTRFIDMDLSGNQSPEAPNEWTKIERAVEHYRSSADGYKTSLDLSRDLLKSGVFHKLLSQDLNTFRQGKEMLQASEVTFPYRRFLCATLDILNLPGTRWQAEPDTLRTALNNVARDVCQITGEIHILTYERDCFAAIVNVADSIRDPEEEASTFFAMLQQLMADTLSIASFIAVGGVYEDLAGISLSFSEARLAREHRRFLQDTGLICYGSLRDAELKYYYPIALEIQLINTVKQGDAAGTDAVLEQIVDRNFGESRLSMNMAQCLLFELMSTSMKILDDLGLSVPEVYGEEYNPFEAVASTQSVDEMIAALHHIYSRLCAAAAAKREGQNSKKLGPIIDYIEENCHNPDLSLGMLADQFQMNQAYLSTFFHEQTGENFVNYIRRMKIERAKRLLLDTKLPLGKIAETVGYSNSNVLIRNFKRETGITPNQFRTEGVLLVTGSSGK